MTLPKDTLLSSGKTLGQVLKSGKKQYEEQLKSPNSGKDIPSLTLKELEEFGIYTGPTLVLESKPRNRSNKKNK
jgi:hypothetical protein